MRRIAAHYIFPVARPPLKNGIVEVDDDGQIIRLIDTGGKLSESRNLEFYDGVIVPGFINTHCHLELSNLYGKIIQHTGLPDFLVAIKPLRETLVELQEKAMQQADAAMYSNGIVAVGDIMNNPESMAVKRNSPLHYYNFIELISLQDEQHANDKFAVAREIETHLLQDKMPVSIVPHAPYSISRFLWKRFDAYFAENYPSVISVHNQENASEASLFVSQTGELYDFILKMGFDISVLQFPGTNSLITTLSHLPRKSNILLVHNTFTTEADIDFAESYSPSVYWCLCPDSNLYIQNHLPDAAMFYKKQVKVTLGTDSLASNTQLSVFAEMQTIRQHFPEISFSTLLQWATENGAKALKFNNIVGTIETGKRPGLVLIEQFDFKEMNISAQSRIKRLI